MAYCDISQVNLGNIIDNSFPPSDGRTYIYKRNNGHLYTYRMGVETHICCDDGMITKIPVVTELVLDPVTNVIISSVPTLPHTPDAAHVMLFSFNNTQYQYDSNRVATVIGNGWTQQQW